MDKAYLIEIITYILGSIGFLLLLLLLKNVLQFLKREKWNSMALLKGKIWLQLLEEMKSPIFGLLLIITSFALVNTLLAGTQNPPTTAEELNPQTLTEALQQYSFTGIFGVMFFSTAGYFYILSGFGSWLKWIARFFLILAPFYILTQMLRYAILLG